METPERRSFLRGLVGMATGGTIVGCVSAPQANPGADAEPASAPISFREVSEERGISYAYVEDDYVQRKSLVSDAGVYLTDFDQNGTDDVLLLGGEEPVLYENQQGQFHRTDRLPKIEGSLNGALFFDATNDGFDDLLLLRTDNTPLFLRHTGEAYEITATGFDHHLENPIGASAADTTGDGRLDVYIAQNGNWDEHQPTGATQSSVSTGDNGNANYLYRNTGDGFELADDAGIAGERWTLAISFADFTGNGHPDIHVGNDYNYDKLYINQGDGTFTWMDLPNSHRNAMSSVAADITGNEKLDIFVTNIKLPNRILRVMPPNKTAQKGNNLFVNVGDGHFADQAGSYGVQNGGFGWAAVIADFNNNQARDIFQTTEHLRVEHQMQRAYGMSEEEVYARYPLVIYPRFFERTYESRFSSRRTSELGFERMDGRGAVGLDTTNNGAIDILVGNRNDTYKLYENLATEHNWLRVYVRGDETQTPLGSRIYLETEQGRQFSIVHANTDFLSQGARWEHFGLGTARGATLRVDWPDEVSHTFEIETVNRQFAVTRGGTLESM